MKNESFADINDYLAYGLRRVTWERRNLSTAETE
jgi:hypothetical protein